MIIVGDFFVLLYFLNTLCVLMVSCNLVVYTFNDRIGERIDDKTLIEFIEVTNNKFIIAGEKRTQMIQDLKNRLIEEGVKFFDNYIKQMQNSLACFREKEIDDWIFTFDIGNIESHVRRLDEILKRDLSVLCDETTEEL